MMPNLVSSTGSSANIRSLLVDSLRGRRTEPQLDSLAGQCYATIEARTEIREAIGQMLLKIAERTAL